MTWLRAGLFSTLISIVLVPVAAFDIRTCDQPLGMESGHILDSAISASSSYVPNVGPQNGRLRVEKAGGAWCPKQQVEKGVREWLEIDLVDLHVITGVQTQGRYDHGRGQEYMEEYSFEYWRPGFLKWKEYQRWDGKQIISGNTDTETVVSHRLMPTVYATKVRILPYSIHRRTVCLRVEVKGCPAEDGVISYQIPKDPAAGLDLSDTAYDGDRSGEVLKGGLGRLVDGEVGGDNFRLDIGYGKGNGWVGWKKTSFPKNFIEVIFEFDEIRNFSQVHLFTNNFFSKEVEVFSKAKVLFSLGGRFYGRSLSFTYMPDHALEVARNVTIQLHGRIARFVKLHLHFANKWLMLSEITFRSDAAPTANITDEAEAELREEQLVGKLGNADLSLNSLEAISATKEEQSYVEAVIGILTAMVLLLLTIFFVILLLSRRQKLQGSPTILRNPFGVTINMKELLMNLAPSSNQGMVAVSSIPTPVTADPPGESPIGFEQYKSPLVSAYIGPNYATLANPNDEDSVRSAVIDDKLDTPSTNGRFSPMPIYTTLEKPAFTPIEKPVYSQIENIEEKIFSPLEKSSYRTLQNQSGQTRVTNQNSRTQKSEHKKHFHTAPREKHRVPPPIVSWNVAPSMGQSYKCRESELKPIPRYCLKVREHIGTCHAGEMVVCETEGLDDIISGCDKIVSVRTGSKDPNQTVSGTTATNSLREVRFLASLTDPSIARILGVCTAEQPPWVIFEYYDMGDLVQYLKYRPAIGVQALTYSCLLHMCTQIASAAKYLESKNVVHKDLAARNCLVGRDYSIKLADVAMCSPLYRQDYTELGGRASVPIRWLPWESILLDRHTCSSGIWSLAVTLWEVLSLARERPYQHMTNEAVIQSAEHMYYGGQLQVLLPRPSICQNDLYDVLCQCWQRDESMRPTAKDVYSFLKAHNAGYQPGLH